MCPKPHGKVAWTEAPNFIRLFPPGIYSQCLEVPVDMQAKTKSVGHT